MKQIYKLLILLALLWSGYSCSSSSDSMDGPEEEVIHDGLNYSPSTPDADQALKITFKAPSSSQLYGYTGDVYLYSGVISEGTWLYCPSSWTDNQSKYKMTKVTDNEWSITLYPSVRSWYSSGTTPVNKLGILIRNSDGTKKGISSDSFVTVTDNKYQAFQPAAVVEKTLPSGVNYGINVGSDKTSVTLVLYDKDNTGAHKNYAYVVGDFNNWTLSNDVSKSQMYRDNTAGCWWITLSGLDASKEYAFQYYLGNSDGTVFRMGDPYCQKILDPDNDASIPSSVYTDNKTYPTGAVGIASVFKINGDGYSWSSNNFSISHPENMVIYEILLRDFTTTGFDATGNLEQAIGKLDYLKSLGVNAIELMPVQEFDGNNSWGYNPCFYFALDKTYGTQSKYKAFIDACHQRGMGVILDVVFNHATGNCPLAKLYWDSTNSRPSSVNPYFNVTAPHPYSYYNDFNHESALTRAYFKRNLKFLIDEYHVDGFRFDFTKGFTNTSSTESTASNYDASRIAILKDYYSAIHAANANAVMICEHFCTESEESELSNAGLKCWRNLNQAYCQSAMGYNSDGCDFTALTTWNTSMTANSWVGYMESHDEERMGYKQTAYAKTPLNSDISARMKQLATNAAFFLTVSGPKMIWQFGELGYDYSINSNSAGVVKSDGSYRTDPKPVKWDYLDVADRKTLHDTYAKLLSLRNANPDLFSQSAFKGWDVTQSYWSQGRTITLQSGSKRLLVLGNFTNGAISISANFGSTGTWHDYMAGTSLSVTSATQSVSVPANGFKIFTNFE
jgi:1,4-alpha-glucan branching enzyme